MPRNQKTAKLQKRDLILAFLAIAVIVTNWVWYQNSKAQDISHKSGSESWLQQQVQIGKLKMCIDEGTKPCDIAPEVQK